MNQPNVAHLLGHFIFIMSFYNVAIVRTTSTLKLRPKSLFELISKTADDFIFLERLHVSTEKNFDSPQKKTPYVVLNI